MQSSSVGNISRRSSIALSAANREANTDDLTIARGLLALQNLPPLKIPRRQSSIFGASPNHFPSRQSPDGVNHAYQIGNLPISSFLKPSRRALRSSNTWTSSDGEYVAEQDEVDDRKVFEDEYNILAQKHGVRTLATFGLEDFADEFGDSSLKRESWFTRKILRKTSSSHSVRAKPDRSLRHKRSISDLSMRLKMKKDKLKDKDLQELVILCGSSRLYLPSAYSASTLCVPTCFRATAQYLVQHGTTTRGLFRIPGSQSTIAALYNHYCSMDEYGDVVAGTVRCPTLPDHIRCDVHDVASAFKKFISGLPGGILGSLTLFDAFISIQTQLHSDPEWTRTKQSRVRARLIALAISTLRSQYRRDLICAVFGLLCMIGRASETARREDDRGYPLPTSDLMGYGPLGIIFGPLLVGDLLEDYTMRLANPHGGLVLLPISPPKSRKERKKKIVKSSDDGNTFNTHVDKIKVANSITEMLITHWRDVVRHMKHMGSMNSVKHLVSLQSLTTKGTKQATLRPSASASFAIRKPPDWDHIKLEYRSVDRAVSPTPMQRSATPIENQDDNNLSIKKQRSKPRPKSLQHLSGARSLSFLSPTVEEVSREDLHNSIARAMPKFDEPSRTSGYSYKDINYSSSRRKIVSDDVIERLDLSSNSEKENERPRQTFQLSQPILEKKPSEDIPQCINVIEGRLSPTSQPHRSSPKKLVKPQTSKDTPNKVTWAVGDTTRFTNPSLSPMATSLRTHEKSGIARHPIRRKSVPVPHKQAQSTSNAIDQLNQSQFSSNIVADKLQPETKLREAISRDDNDFRAPRRLERSEPGRPTTASTRPTQRVSKSLCEDPKQRRNLFYASNLPKDPLSGVSREDDVASLMSLAQVLNIDKKSNEDIVETKSPQPFIALSQNPLLQHSADAKPNRQFSSPLQDFVGSTNTKKEDLLTDSPSSRVSSLIAKFNHKDSSSDLISRPPSRLTKSPQRAIEEDNQHNLDNPKERLVAPYMMNSPSPTKSQKSANSQKTPISTRSPGLSRNRPNTDTRKLPSSASTPKRFLRSSIHDSTPLRPVPRSPENKESSPAKPSSPFSVYLRPIQKSGLEVDITVTRETQKTSWPSHFDGNFSTLTDSTSSHNSAMDRMDTATGEHSPTSREHPNFCGRQQIRTKPLDRRLNTDHITSEKLLPSSEPLPVAQHIHLGRPQSSSLETAGFIHPPSSSTENLASANPVSRVNTPGPGRSNSLLYNQVRNLQRQLAARTEEVLQLKKQLEARQNLDVGTLREQLREANKDIEIWRSKAVIAEKQLQIANRSWRRSDSEQHKYSSMGCSVGMPANAEITQTSLRGLDGARSTGGWNSEESCDTVIREIRENAITGSEYSIWAAETKNPHGYMVPDD